MERVSTGSLIVQPLLRRNAGLGSLKLPKQCVYNVFLEKKKLCPTQKNVKCICPTQQLQNGRFLREVTVTMEKGRLLRHCKIAWSQSFNSEIKDGFGVFLTTSQATAEALYGEANLKRGSC